MNSSGDETGQGPIPTASAVSAGDRVAALWSNGGFYLGRVTRVDGGNFEVLFDDGDQGVVTAAELKRTASAKEPIAPGARVLAAWRGARMFTGVVMGATDLTATIRWDDGDTPMVVAKERLAVLADAEGGAGAAATGDLQAGARVAAMWSDGTYWGATIEQVESGCYAVVYDDGERALLAAAELMPITAEEIALGSQVLACWRGGARMFPGTVTARHGNSYTVRWDDGDTPTDELRERIVVLRGS